MPEPKPPKGYETWLYSFLTEINKREFSYDSLENARAEYATLRAEAEKWRARNNRSGWDAYAALRSRVTEGSKVIESALTESWNAVVDKACDEPRKDDDDDDDTR